MPARGSLVKTENRVLEIEKDALSVATLQMFVSDMPEYDSTFSLARNPPPPVFIEEFETDGIVFLRFSFAKQTTAGRVS